MCYPVKERMCNLVDVNTKAPETISKDFLCHLHVFTSYNILYIKFLSEKTKHSAIPQQIFKIRVLYSYNVCQIQFWSLSILLG